MAYLYPVQFTRSTSWWTHKLRIPPSQEPGIDMFCPIGTPVLAAGDGWVVDTGDSIVPATGRYVTIDIDDGRRVRYLHLSRRVVNVRDRVSRGQVIAYSGATGYGEEDWSWNVAETGGAHVHMTLWASQRYVFGPNGTLDPAPYFEQSGSAAAVTAAPLPKGPLMALSDAEQAELLNNTRQVYNALFKGGPSMDDQGRPVAFSLGNITEFLDRIDQRVLAIHQATFDGGPSMPDGGKSVGQSLAEIRAEIDALRKAVGGAS